jgi:hypothetical protein
MSASPWQSAVIEHRDVMGRFASTIAYYESARPPYPDAFFAKVARRLGFDRNQRLLDVGGGPGILAIGFAIGGGQTTKKEATRASICRLRRASGARSRTQSDLGQGAKSRPQCLHTTASCRTISAQ